MEKRNDERINYIMYYTQNAEANDSQSKNMWHIILHTRQYKKKIENRQEVEENKIKLITSNENNSGVQRTPT